MSGEKRFGTSMFGFAKSDVNSYIEKMLREFDEKLKNKDDEIGALKNQLKEVRFKYDELKRNAEQINEDRSKIASILLKAQEKAEEMLEEAKKQALDEKKKLEHLVEEEREKLVDVKGELKTLKSEVVKTLKKYEGQLNSITKDDETVELRNVNSEEKTEETAQNK